MRFSNNIFESATSKYLKKLNESDEEIDELVDKVGGNYDDFIYELSNFRATMNNWYDQCDTGLARQIVEETIEAFNNLLKKYEYTKDIEIISALDETDISEE